jgi:hypothetical protein
MLDPAKIFGQFPDGFRMTYKDLWDAGSSVDMEIHYEAFDKLVEEHGGNPKLYWSEAGIYA